ncbi:hypothetical protein BJV74DRAFT_989708 [Russula compacta]|nr:hypothetical protein BJV74DRAFT_989708 [Russula compacta]
MDESPVDDNITVSSPSLYKVKEIQITDRSDSGPRSLSDSHSSSHKRPQGKVLEPQTIKQAQGQSTWTWSRTLTERQAAVHARRPLSAHSATKSPGRKTRQRRKQQPTNGTEDEDPIAASSSVIQSTKATASSCQRGTGTTPDPTTKTTGAMRWRTERDAEIAQTLERFRASGRWSCGLRWRSFCGVGARGGTRGAGGEDVCTPICGRPCGWPVTMLMTMPAPAGTRNQMRRSNLFPSTW